MPHHMMKWFWALKELLINNLLADYYKHNLSYLIRLADQSHMRASRAYKIWVSRRFELNIWTPVAATGTVVSITHACMRQVEMERGGLATMTRHFLGLDWDLQMTEQDPSEGQIVQIPQAKFIDNVDDYLAGQSNWPGWFWFPQLSLTVYSELLFGDCKLRLTWSTCAISVKISWKQQIMDRKLLHRKTSVQKRLQHHHMLTETILGEFKYADNLPKCLLSWKEPGFSLYQSEACRTHTWGSNEATQSELSALQVHRATAIA